MGYGTRSQAKKRSPENTTLLSPNRKRALPPAFEDGIRRSKRGSNSLVSLARIIVGKTDPGDPPPPDDRKRKNPNGGDPVLFITGAGLSAESGIPTFRGGSNAIWSQSLWSHATREAFRLDPLGWYNDFWLCNFPTHYDGYDANCGHEVLAELTEMGDVKIVTQNVDGLHSKTKFKWNCEEKLVEAHGRIGLYKCIPDVDTDSECESDDDDERPVKLGRRESGRGEIRTVCAYAAKKSIGADEILPTHVRAALNGTAAASGASNAVKRMLNERGEVVEESPEIDTPPKCPGCGRFCLPQALLFDEGYHSHQFYQFEKVESWIENASAVVFVGTSFSVAITDVALKYAHEHHIPVYNFNIGRLESRTKGVINVTGSAAVTLPLLLEYCKQLTNSEK